MAEEEATSNKYSKQKKYYDANKAKILVKLKTKRSNTVAAKAVMTSNDTTTIIPTPIESTFYLNLIKIRDTNRPFFQWTNNVRVLNKDFLSRYEQYNIHRQYREH